MCCQLIALTFTNNCLLWRRAKGKGRFLGAPQTPSGELRPLHPLLLRGSQFWLPPSLEDGLACIRVKEMHLLMLDM